MACSPRSLSNRLRPARKIPRRLFRLGARVLGKRPGFTHVVFRTTTTLNRLPTVKGQVAVLLSRLYVFAMLKAVLPVSDGYPCLFVFFVLLKAARSLSVDDGGSFLFRDAKVLDAETAGGQAGAQFVAGGLQSPEVSTVLLQ